MNDLKLPAPALAPPAFEDDFVVWTEYQLALLRARRFEQLDLENLIGELEAMVSQHRSELRSRLRIIIVDLLKCQFQPDRKARSWLSTLTEQRARVADLLEESPSLVRLVDETANSVYPRAVRGALVETRLPGSVFPAVLPYTANQLLDDGFVP